MRSTKLSVPRGWCWLLRNSGFPWQDQKHTSSLLIQWHTSVAKVGTPRGSVARHTCLRLPHSYRPAVACAGLLIKKKTKQTKQKGELCGFARTLSFFCSSFFFTTTSHCTHFWHKACSCCCCCCCLHLQLQACIWYHHHQLGAASHTCCVCVWHWLWFSSMAAFQGLRQEGGKQ